MINLSAIGFVGNDAQIKDANGKKVVQFSICIDKSYKNKENVKVDRKTWIECSGWNHVNVAPYLKKGTLVYVSGEPSTNAYKTNDGELRSSQQITVVELELLSSKKEN